MWWKLILNSFRRDRRKKAVAILAVALATCLATFLLNWSLNLGDRIERDLRAYGANILVVPQGESLSDASGGVDLPPFGSNRYLDSSEIGKLRDIFWTNQIVAYAPLLPQKVSYGDVDVMLVGTEFGEQDPQSNLPRTAPYLSLQGQWPSAANDAVAGSMLAQQFGWQIGRDITLSHENRQRAFRITGIVQSGGVEENRVFALLEPVQDLVGQPDRFKQLLISAVVTPQNSLYFKYQQNPGTLTPKEFERYSCTPYVTSVAQDIGKVFTEGEARIVRQISETEEKIVGKVNRLMILVTLAALIAASLTMTSTTTGMILQRRKELALMKAIGSSNSSIVLYLFTEIVILGILGSLLGYAMGSLLSLSLSRTIFESVFELKWIVLPFVSLVGLLIVLCGSVWPLSRSISWEPAQALKDL